MWDPFEKKNFKEVEEIDLNNDIHLERWLYNRGLPFSEWVYVLPNYRGKPITMTWKMVIKNAEHLFFGDDIIIFDESNQWCLVYWHEDKIFFGKINTANSEIGYKEVEELSRKAKKYPGFKHPYKG